MFGRATAALTEFLFPRRCSGCQTTGAILCSACAAQLPAVPQPQCLACGLPLPPGVLCRHCAEFPLSLDALGAPYVYTANLKSALLRFKYVGARTAAQDLSPLLGAYVAATNWQVDGVLGVPLHPRRQRERGFNQADALAAEVGRLLGLPRLTALERVKDTPPQARQPDRQARWSNVAAAFRASGNASINGRRILVVDDVCTTGATLSACGVALRAAGAGAAYGVTLARALER